MYINCTGSKLPPKGLKRRIEHLWTQSPFVQFLCRRTAIFPRYPTIDMYIPFEIGCTYVHQLYRILITAKRIEKAHRTFVSTIPIRTISLQAYSHSSQVSHNRYVHTIWNWLYVCTWTVQDRNYNKRIEIVHGTFVISIPIRTVSVQAYSHSSQVSHNTYVQTIWNWLYVCTSTVQDANFGQIDKISGWDICYINSNSYSWCTGVPPWLNASPYKINGPIHS